MTIDETPQPSAELLRFHGFELDLTRYELRKDGAPIPVEPQVFDLISLLARNAARTVTKAEIYAAIWGNRIVSEAALFSRIKSARSALGDDGKSQRMIATVHRRGFRFVAELERERSPIEDAVAALSATSAGADMARRPTVAVLPFVNMSRDPSEDYLADGIAEDITTAIAKHRWLTVVARNPAFSFRASADGVRTIGEKLGAGYIVSGSLRRAGERVRITAQLADAESEHTIWSERFDRDITDIFDLQDEISEMVAARIEAELGMNEQRKAQRRQRKNLGAWDLYQLGSAEFYRFTREANLKAQEHLRQSIVLDPTFAGAHSRLAYAIVLSMVYFDIPSEPETLDDALSIATRAIALDDQDANGYFVLGRVYLARCEYDLAIDALQHALALNPALAVSYCGLGDSLAYEGRLDEAIEQFEIAIRLSPHDPFRWAFYSYRSLAHLFRGEHHDAAIWARKAVSVPNAQYWARAHLVSALGHLGDVEQSQQARAELMALKPEFSLAFAREHLFYLKHEEQLEIYLAGLKAAGVRAV